jgi:hypothetical protein
MRLATKRRPSARAMTARRSNRAPRRRPNAARWPAGAPGAVSIAGSHGSLAAATVGKAVGGPLSVAGVNWVAYLRGERGRSGRSRVGPTAYARI